MTSTGAADPTPQPSHVDGPFSSAGLTPRALMSGFAFSIILCAMNSYLTLSFGVIEEGPTIAALFFFALFLMSKTKITNAEMVIVSTMGSAGGSLGFISNFYAAKSMTGAPYGVMDMALFGIVSSLVGLVMVIPLRQLLVLREDLPWPGSKATYSVIKTLVDGGDPKQALYLLLTFLAMTFFVLGNTDAGFGWWPDGVALPGLVFFGGAIAFAPFAIGGSYLMGMRTCVGFLAGAIVLMIMSRQAPVSDLFDPALLAAGKGLDAVNIAATTNPVSPNAYYWPGLGFLVASGLTVMAVNWRTIAGALRSMIAIGGKTDDDDPIMSGKALAAFAIVAFIATAVILNVRFALSITIIVVLVLVAGFIQNIIATRAAAQTAFNPARVMGILLQGVTSVLGGSSAAVNLTGAGFVAGSGAQAGNLTGDMAYGRWLRVKSSSQFGAQLLTVIPCAVVSAYVFEWIRTEKGVDSMVAPVAKMWAASAQVFDQGLSALPPNALQALAIGAAIGVVYTLLELVPAIRKWMPETIGLGLGLVLSVPLSLSFFLGGFLFWIVLGRWFKVRDITLTTIAVGCIVAEGIGGVLKPLLKLAGVPGL